MHLVKRFAFILAALPALAAVAPALGQVSSEPAALVIFPHIVVDGSREIDTVIELSNASAAPTEVRCLYEDATPECLGGSGGGTCLPDPRSCDGACMPRGTTTPFRLRLTASQPLAWSVAHGLAETPLSGNGGTHVPPIDAASFQGTLRCVVVDERGRPAERNVLAGTASIETANAASAAQIDAAQYTAIGLAALAGTNDGDEILQLGGPHAEYAACPASLVLPHLFDGATVRAGERDDTVLTTLALVPCGGDLLGDATPRSVVQLLAYNEFAQRFSTSRAVVRQFVSQLSLFDSAIPERSIFSVGVEGTLTGQVYLQGVGGGVVGVAVESHQASDTGRQHTAALRLFGEGADADTEVLGMLRPPCPGDCDSDGEVRIDELLLGVGVALDTKPVNACPAADSDASGTVRIDELTNAVRMALSSCPAPAPPTTPPTPEQTPVPTPPSPSAPGPEITFLGIASGDDAPQQPIGADDQGRPIYTWPVGQGFSLIVEARPGSNRRLVGFRAAADSADVLPDLQVIVSRPLGDGSAAVCDADLPVPGGVPAVDPFAFSAAPEVVHAINDLGCRTDDGAGQPQQRPSSKSCLRIPPTDQAATVSTVSTAQFCIPIARAWAFAAGDTIVAARVRDVQGMTGPVQEMVIRVPPGP